MKKSFYFFLSFVYAASLIQAPAAKAAVSSLPITAASALLMDQATNKIVYAKTPNLRRAPASTTKLLTAIVALKLMDPNRIVTVPRYATTMQPSKIHIRSGERFRLGDLINAVLISSANDAAAAVAIATAGSIQSFAAHMNRTAKSLGASHSNFVNPSGLPDSRQYSTVYDMAMIMKETQRYAFIDRSLKTKTMTIRSVKGRKIFLRNHNRMLWRDRREVLGKTGWTRAARHCFVGEINVAGRSVVVSMLGSRRLWPDLKTLVDYQFAMLGISAPATDPKVKVKNNIQIQAALRRAGFYRGPLNGKIGPITTRAIKRFQQKNGIKTTGYVGPLTWNALKKYL